MTCPDLAPHAIFAACVHNRLVRQRPDKLLTDAAQGFRDECIRVGANSLGMLLRGCICGLSQCLSRKHIFAASLFSTFAHACAGVCALARARVSVPVCACVCVHVCVPPQVTITDASVIFQRVGEAEFSENSPRLCMRFALDMHALTLASPRACARRLS